MVYCKRVIGNNETNCSKRIKMQSHAFRIHNKKTEAQINNTDKTEGFQKTDWQSYKKEKKELKSRRKQKKPMYIFSLDMKQIYEKLKCKKVENKEELVLKLYTIVKKKDCIQKAVMSHDTARIIQSILKYGTPSIRNEIFKGLLPIIVHVSTLKYSHYCVLRMIKYGNSNIKKQLIESMYGHIVYLTTHVVANKIVDILFLSWANKKQKLFMKQEFYGDIFKKSKDNNVEQLCDVYKNTPHLRSAVLGAVKSNLERAANKNIVDNSLIHAVLLDFLMECTNIEGSEIINIFSPMTPSLITTKEGCKAAIMCFWYSSTKERRAIVKSLKDHLEKICTHEQGYIFILAIINTMDDTKAIKKYIFDRVLIVIESIINNQWGRKIIEWFVSPDDAELFHPQMISFLANGLKYSKKDKIIRRQEIFDLIQEDLCNSIIRNSIFWVQNGQIGIVTAAILKKLPEKSFIQVAHSLAKIICQPNWTVNLTHDSKLKTDVDSISNKSANTVLGIDDAGLHLVLKRMIKQSKERNEISHSFGSIVIGEIHNETVEIWIQFNRACFIFLNIFENSLEGTKTVFKKNTKTIYINIEEPVAYWC